MGKLIYRPKGKANEYALWACNLYNGCTHACHYCYLRHGLAKGLLGKEEPTIKGGMNERTAYAAFCYELEKDHDAIARDGGLFFNFSSDPMLPETRELNTKCMLYALDRGVRVRMLTKGRIFEPFVESVRQRGLSHLADFGFTLTGCDELEPGAASNSQRIFDMRWLKEAGMRTWASIEPVIDPAKSMDMIEQSLQYCDEYRIGLLSGKKTYTKDDITAFKKEAEDILRRAGKRFFFKNSVDDFLK